LLYSAFFEYSKMMNRQTRFCPGGPPSSVSFVNHHIQAVCLGKK
jgi:hypothetical protein